MPCKDIEKERIRQRKKTWKGYGLKDDLNEIHEIYMNTKECYYCNKKFTEDDRKSMEHDHLSGHFRCICCHKCNMYMKKIDMIRLKLMLDIHRHNCLKKG